MYVPMTRGLVINQEIPLGHTYQNIQSNHRIISRPRIYEEIPIGIDNRNYFIQTTEDNSGYLEPIIPRPTPNQLSSMPRQNSPSNKMILLRMIIISTITFLIGMVAGYYTHQGVLVTSKDTARTSKDNQCNTVHEPSYTNITNLINTFKSGKQNTRVLTKANAYVDDYNDLNEAPTNG